jgi:hypothetical protein
MEIKGFSFDLFCPAWLDSARALPNLDLALKKRVRLGRRRGRDGDPGDRGF